MIADDDDITSGEKDNKEGAVFVMLLFVAVNVVDDDDVDELDDEVDVGDDSEEKARGGE